MSIVKYKDPATGAWIPVPALKVMTEYEGGSVIGIPSGIVAEADRVASSIKSKMTPNSVNFILMSDMHEMGDNDWPSDPTIIPKYRRANLNAGQGARLIAEKIDPDFFANLGDLAWGNQNYTVFDMAQSITNARCYTAGLEPLTECFFTPGNHDVGYKSGGFDENLVMGMIGKYRYTDLTAKKVRVICLNTADVTDGTDREQGLSGEQLQWFADALDLSGKSDAAQWSIIVLSHHPLDWAGVDQAAKCLAAYLSGTNYSVTHDGMTVSKDFTGKNMATFIANFHGHVHCFRVGNIGDTKALRVAIPNACFGRNNDSYAGTQWGETTSYPKSDNNTGKNTAFCVVSIDLDRKIIYADCFGAGYDRVISYGGEDIVTYSVTNSLSNATTSNGTASIAEGAGYSAEITANSGYALTGIQVTMGGVDITSTAVSGSRIAIASVTGDLIITATTKVDSLYDVTNLVLASEAEDSTEPYNGTGYKEGVYCSSNGGDSADAACVSTGYIPYAWKPENVIYIRGATLSNASHVRVYGYLTKGSAPSGAASASGPTLSAYFTVEELESGTYYKLTPLNSVQQIVYLRLTLIGTGENFIVTVKEPIVK